MVPTSTRTSWPVHASVLEDGDTFLDRPFPPLPARILEPVRRGGRDKKRNPLFSQRVFERGGRDLNPMKGSLSTRKRIGNDHLRAPSLVEG
jgi:hypothetical protein